MKDNIMTPEGSEEDQRKSAYEAGQQAALAELDAQISTADTGHLGKSRLESLYSRAEQRTKIMEREFYERRGASLSDKSQRVLDGRYNLKNSVRVEENPPDRH
ncbi:MAG: hypothetical protein HY007_03485 [Candidatus Sungbacteria bacterium]|nr:hypothetical protein [Candidatus Sungbacteria bacterium]